MTAADRLWHLAELLPGPELERLGPLLAALLGSPPALTDADGRPLWGQAPAGAAREALVLEPAPAAGPDRAPVGYLLAAAAPPQLQGAARLLETLLQAQVRCLAQAESLEAQVRLRLERLEQLRRQIYQAEKLAAVGQLAAGVAHEINNPISFVRSNLGTFGGYVDKFRALRPRLAEGESAWRALDLDFVLDDSADLLRECIGGLDRVARIVRDLKGYSNVDRPAEQLVDLNENLRQVARAAERQRPPGVALQLGLSQLPRLLCLPGHLNQVFLNLVSNGMQAVADKGGTGTVTVSSRAVPGGIEVRVADDGVGMTAAQQARVFEPFFTTRPVGQGTGLGLTVARDIVQAHGGTIQIDSQPGQGTTATVFLPA
jgi:signal transduction histidine kinase